MSSPKRETLPISRRTLLKNLGFSPFLLRPAPFLGAGLLFGDPTPPTATHPSFPFADVRLTPHYPARPPLADILRLVAPGSDEYATEKDAAEVDSQLAEWSRALRASVRDLSAIANSLDASVRACSLAPEEMRPVRAGSGVEVVRCRFGTALAAGPADFLKGLRAWLAPIARVETAEFEIYGIQEMDSDSPAVRLDIRYDMVAALHDGRREERVGSWRMEWQRSGLQEWKIRQLEAGEETRSSVRGPVYADVTSRAMSGAASYEGQLLRGVDYWRTVLDGACAIDIYSNTGVAAGDFDNDGLDDFYVCQPAGLPNRLYRNRGDGTFEDVTEKAGVGLLDNTACALFADFRNTGVQDLLVVCGTGPVLFLNQGDGTFRLKPDAFGFAQPPQGSFTHAALADYDGDGRLDIYFCTYMYYLGLDQYHYPIPYYDARNGPPNCLMHNEGNGTFVETTAASGLNADNNRYSFSCAWGDSNNNGRPDLFVANDFGSSQLYRNNGDGTFTVISKQSHVEEVGAGMSCCWADFDNDGRQDIYVPSMWEAAGQRVSEQKQFHEQAPESIRALYQRHARGNVLYRNLGDDTFQNIGHEAGVEMGRWSWCSDFLDFDHDGFADLYVSNGYISGVERRDLASFFWRQVVAQSPEDATPSPAYEQGWGAINELIRSDNTWHGYARNVLFANNRDGTFSEVSGPSGLDFIDDSRAFALADLDQDGRLEIILKNRNAPQLRILHNVMTEIGRSIAFRLRGHKSNRDAIGAAITLETGALRQTKYLQAGSGFLAQHSKEVFFGLGSAPAPCRATVRWPSGLLQHFDNVPIDHRIELEEGVATFSAKAFRPPPAAWHEAAPAPALEPLPAQVETWLLEPLRAPEFSLPDLSGNLHELSESRGQVLLLHFWATDSPLAHLQLRSFERHRAAMAANHFDVWSVNADDSPDLQAVRSLVAQEGLTFPVLMANKEVAGIYNILYRYLFDRRRDLALPTSFLLDRDGMIVKVYQGPVDITHLLEDAKAVPGLTHDRMRKALPFPGQLLQGPFARNDFTYGVALFQHGYLNQAEESFQQVVAVKPSDAEAWYNLGTLNLRRNNFAQAREYLKRSLALRADYPEAWNNLGMMAAQEGRPDEAIQDFRQSLLLRPTYAVALLNLGNVYRRQKDFSEAEQCLAQALAIDPRDPEVYYAYGMLSAQQDQMDRAQKYLRKALDLRPDYPEALNNLGVLFVHMQDYAQAEAQFQTCMRLVPNFDQAYLNLAGLYAIENDRDRAREIIEKLLQIQPGNPAAKQALEMLH
jgi:Flp pilus assembly protein TadD/peroxiredoxin